MLLKYSVMTYVGKESKKSGYIYNWLTLLYTLNKHNTINQLYSNKNFRKETPLQM